jgi:plasmid stabilization system protein ParE
VIPVRFAPEVSDEIAEAASWYEARSRGLGNEFIAEIETTLPIIGSRPQSFPRLDNVSPRYEIRRALLPRFPYAVVFLVRVEELRVLAIAHAKRKPGYWLSRVR